MINKLEYALTYLFVSITIPFSLQLFYLFFPKHSFLQILAIIMLLTSGIFINYYYSKKIQKNNLIKLLISVFHFIGFFYIIGYDNKLISAGSLIKETAVLYIKFFKKIRLTLFLFLLSGFALSLLAILSIIIEGVLKKGALVALNNLFMLIFLVIFIVILLTLRINLIQQLSNLIFQKNNLDYKELTKKSLTIVWPLILVTVLSVILVAFGFILFMIPAIIFAYWFYYSKYILIIEKTNVWESIKTSQKLVFGRWWATFWRVQAPAFVLFFIIYSIQLIINLIFSVLPSGMISLFFFSSLSACVYVFIILPINTLITIILYKSAKENPVEEPLLPPTKIN